MVGLIQRVRRWWARRRGLPVQSIRGRNNQVKIGPARRLNLEIDIVGDDNQIEIGAGAWLEQVTLRLRGSGQRVLIGENCRVSRSAMFWLEDEGATLEIGAGTTLVSAHIAVTEPHSQVRIGADCMLATDVEIRSGDSHAIYDGASGERINPAQEVWLGEHVWIGARALVLKGARIGDGSVVAAAAVVTGAANEPQPGVILAGNPARVVRQNIRWTRERSIGHDNDQPAAARN